MLGASSIASAPILQELRLGGCRTPLTPQGADISLETFWMKVDCGNAWVRFLAIWVQGIKGRMSTAIILRTLGSKISSFF